MCHVENGDWEGDYGYGGRGGGRGRGWSYRGNRILL